MEGTPGVIKHKLTRRKMFDFLDEFSQLHEPAATLYLPPGASDTVVSSHLRRIQYVDVPISDLSKIITSSPTGAVVFWGFSHKCVILPPFPIKDQFITDDYDISTLVSILSNNYTIGIVLVRLGNYSIGMCEGGKLILHKTGTGLIHARHRQGGSSAARFQRRCEDQTSHFLERVAEYIEEKFAPYARTLDYLVYGGARTTIQELRKHSRFLKQFDDRLLPPLLTIPDPDYDVLKQAVTEVWSSKLVEWKEK